MLNFILGRAGNGKSYTVMEKISQNINSDNSDNSDKKIFLIVPEQFTFETEKQYLEKLGAKGLANLKITSFSRLSQYIFKQFGGTATDYADNSKKLVLMNMALHQVHDLLTVYNKVALNMNFSENILSIVDELKNANMDEISLQDKVNSMSDGLLKEKTKDISLIFSTYNALMSQNYKDTLDDISKAVKIIEQENFFKDSIVFIDEFKDFTKTEMDFIEVAMQQSSDLYVSLCMGKDVLKSENVENNLFYPVYKTYNHIKQMARQMQVKVSAHGTEKSPVLTENKRFNNDELAHLEQNVFQLSPKKYNKDVENIHCVLARNEYEEIDFVCAKIKDIVQHKNIKYKDIKVVSRDLTDYTDYFKTAFTKYNIPYYMDDLKEFDENPLTKYIQEIFSVVSSLNTQSIISMLKCGFSQFSVSDIADLENYTYLWDIKGNQWNSEFKYCTQGITVIQGDEEEEEETQKLAKLNEIREYIITPINKFRQVNQETTQATSTDFGQALIDFLDDTNVMQVLEEKIKEIETLSIQEENNLSERMALAQEYHKTWEMIDQVIHILVEVLGDIKLDRNRYFELFNLVVANFDMGTIPQSMDCVIVGSAERMKTADTKVMFIVGANDKVFPYVPTSAGIYTDSERQTLIDQGISMSAPLKDKIREEKFIAYKTLTMASDTLYVLSRKNNLKGEVKNRSHIMLGMEKMFGNTITQDVIDMDKTIYCQTNETAFGVLSSNYTFDTPLTASLRYYFSGQSGKENYPSKMDNIERLITKDKFKLRKIQNARELFGSHMRLRKLVRAEIEKLKIKPFNIYHDIFANVDWKPKSYITISASKIEKFHQCKFKYFCDYGLRLTPKTKVELNSLNRGNVIHDVLCNVCSDIKDFKNIDQEQLKENISNSVDEYVSQNLYGYESEDLRIKYLYDKVKNTVYGIMSNIYEEVKQGQFIPSDFEFSIGEKSPHYIKTANETRVKIVGKVDRVDTFKDKTDDLYIRVIDYKSGVKKFKMSDIQNGLNLQMFLYLMCLEKNKRGKYKSAKGAGVLYMPASDVASYLDRNIEESDIKKASQNHYKMNGVVLAKENVLFAMEKELTGQFTPIAVTSKATKKRKKDTLYENLRDDVFEDDETPNLEFFSKASAENLITYDNMQSKYQEIEEIVSKMISTLYDGNIEAKALKSKDFDPCTYCDYSNVCLNSDTDDYYEYQDEVKVKDKDEKSNSQNSQTSQTSKKGKL